MEPRAAAPPVGTGVGVAEAEPAGVDWTTVETADLTVLTGALTTLETVTMGVEEVTAATVLVTATVVSTAVVVAAAAEEPPPGAAAQSFSEAGRTSSVVSY